MDSPTDPRSDQGPDSQISIARAFRWARRVVRETAGPLLIVWLTAATLEFALLDWLSDQLPTVFGLLNAGGTLSSGLHNIGAVPAILLLVLLLSVSQTALFRPLRQIMLDDEVLSVKDIVWSGLSRVVNVLALESALVLIFVTAALLCFALGSSVNIWVFLPLSFLLSPARYFVAARDMTTGEALGRSVEAVRRHWLCLFAVQGIAVALELLATDGAGPVPTGYVLSFLRDLFAHLATGYTSWVLLSGAYLAVDSYEPRGS